MSCNEKIDSTGDLPKAAIAPAVSTDLAPDRPVTPEELDALCRLLGDGLQRLLDETALH